MGVVCCYSMPVPIARCMAGLWIIGAWTLKLGVLVWSWTFALLCSSTSKGVEQAGFQSSVSRHGVELRAFHVLAPSLASNFSRAIFLHTLIILESHLNKHKIRLRNIFLIQNNDLSESNPKCGSCVEETSEIAWFLNKLGRFFVAQKSSKSFCMFWTQDAQFHSRKLLLNACICS